MKAVLLVVTFVTLSSASPTLREQWSSFKAQYGKSYGSEKEEQYRLSVFSDNLKKIEEHNLKHKAGLVSYYMKLNKFADLTTVEFGALMTGYKKTELVHSKVTGLTYQPPANVEVPDSIDWRKSGYVTPVKEQGNCYSGYAFSATGSLEGQLFKKTGKLVSLSEQQIVDCSVDFQNYGCEGGIMESSYESITHAGGIMSEESYPYKGVNGTCKFQLQKAVEDSAVKSYVDLPIGDVKALETAVATIGPISVEINSESDGFRNYGGGIFDGKGCVSNFLDHAVLIVGYGSENGKDYWIIKNSWGTQWGEEGYMRLEKKNYENICGIAVLASYPVL